MPPPALQQPGTPNALGTVSVLTIDGSTVYVGGTLRLLAVRRATASRRFDRLRRRRVHLHRRPAGNRIAALDASTGLATAWDPDADNEVGAFAVSGSTVYVAGRFTSIGGQNRIAAAALDASTGLATDWDPNPQDGGIGALGVSGSIVYAGGDFAFIGGRTCGGIAALDAGETGAADWNPHMGGGGPG